MKDKMRIVQVGLGCRGMDLLKLILNTMDDIQVVGVCDHYADRNEMAASKIEEKSGIRSIITSCGGITPLSIPTAVWTTLFSERFLRV